MTAPVTTRTQQDDRYTIERTLGETPCGPVLLATEGARKRLVAIFTLPAERQAEDRAAYDACLTRFQRGAEVSRLVRHPNLIETYEVTTTPDGAARSVVEYVEGRTLHQQLASGPLAVGRAVAVDRDVSRALAALHAAGMGHRDVAPANILLASDGSAKLTGYGEAQIGRADLMYGLNADRPGTPGYISPEQESGLGGVDARSDLYSLGAVLYAMLTGGTYAARQRTLALARPDLPPALAALVANLLERQPAFRAQRADDVARALDAILDPSAPAPSASESSPMPTPVGASFAPSAPPPSTPPPVEQFTLPPSTMVFSPSLSPTSAIQPPPSSLAAPPVAAAPVAPAPPRPQPQRQPPPQQQAMYPPPPYPVVPPVQYGGPPQRPGGNVFAPLPAYGPRPPGPRPVPPARRGGSGRRTLGIVAAVIIGFLILRSATPSSRTTVVRTPTPFTFATATRALPTATRAVPTTTSRAGSASATSGTAPAGSRTVTLGTITIRTAPQGSATSDTPSPASTPPAGSRTPQP